MPGWEQLREAGVFDFRVAVEEWQAIKDRAQELGASGDDRRSLDDTGDLSLLGAAQMQIQVSFLTGAWPADFPLLVLPGLMTTAFMTYACSLTYIHSNRNPELTDLSVFTGDITKLRAIGITTLNAVREKLVDAINELASLYAEAAADQSQRFALNGWVHLQGLVWTATLGPLLHTDNSDTFDRYLNANARFIPGLESQEPPA